MPVGAVPATVAVKVTWSPNMEGLSEEESFVVVVVLGITTCCSTVEVAAALFASPEYVAVSEWIPAVRVEVLHVAVRLSPMPVRATALHSTVAPILNVTAPVGIVPVTVAVKVTFWPNVDGLSEEVSSTSVPVTTCDNIGDVEGAPNPSPEYAALKECVPIANAVVLQDASRFKPMPVTTTALHSTAAPS